MPIAFIQAMRSAVFLTLLFSSIAGDPYECQGQHGITLDANNPTFFFNNTQIAAEQYCQWNFLYPSQYTAEILIYTSNMNQYGVTVDSQWGDTVQRIMMPSATGNLTFHMMWPPTSFDLIISTTDWYPTFVTMNITIKLMSDAEPTQLNTAVDQQPFFVQFMDWEAETAITAQSTSSGELVLSLASPLDLGYEYANYFIFDGPLSTGQFLGTFYTVLYEPFDGFYISTTDTLTFYRAMESDVTATLIVNDYENMKNLSSFHVKWSPYNRADYQQTVFLDASSGPTALTVLNEADGSNAIYLQDITIVPNPEILCIPSIELLAGGMVRDTQETLIGTYRDSKLFDDRNYPQFLPGTARTFVLQSGFAVIYYTSNVTNTNNSLALDGRNGFVMSDNYPFNAPNQNSQDFVLNSADGSMFLFEYTINDANPNEDAYLNFSMKGADQNSLIVNLHNITAPGTFNVTASEMTMTIFGGNQPSTGTYIPYRIHSMAASPATEKLPTTMPTVATTPSSTPDALSSSTLSVRTDPVTTASLTSTRQPDGPVGTEQPEATTTTDQQSILSTTATESTPTTTPKSAYTYSTLAVLTASLLFRIL